MTNLSTFKNISLLKILASFCLLSLLFPPLLSAQEQASQRFDFNSLTGGGGIGGLNLGAMTGSASISTDIAVARRLNKGVTRDEVEDNFNRFSKANDRLLQNGTCSAPIDTLTYGHSKETLGSYNRKILNIENNRCIINDTTFKGNSKLVLGKLWTYLSPCSSYDCYICSDGWWNRTDKIAYYFPKYTVEVSQQQFDSYLRLDVSESGDYKDESKNRTPTPTPGATRTPGSGSAEGNDCNYAQASSIANKGGYSENYINWVMSIGERESGFSNKEASTNFYNMPANTYDANGKQTGWKNANVANAMANGMSLSEAQALYGDYGYYQNNAKDSQNAVSKYGLSQQSADALSNGGGTGNYSLEDQTLAMAEYIKKKYPDSAAAAENGDYASADDGVDGFWFAARKPNPCTKKANNSTLANN